nr:hypothetical protein [Klebsiella pneumoniae]
MGDMGHVQWPCPTLDHPGTPWLYKDNRFDTPSGKGFGIGHARGASKAKAKADQQRTEENAAATVAAAERRAEVTKGASDVQEDVKRMGDDDVDRELREKFTRPGSR